ncbi:hypothetical protein KP509_03G016100 [Ceratopteris richardii]|uniref:HVA22-like protein n=1 Tax=Ceratopteris richardii TaxID=49495 RepID=A0A8T2UXQ0_CERRI|nr:hypothetical protein KP509_03G016100 [Ceratopteris richardii]
MVGSLITRALIMLVGYLYPAYKCFKCVEMNRLDTKQLTFWCKYWIILAVLTVLERLGDTFASWMPLYGEAKIAFIVYLWNPKTSGNYQPPSPHGSQPTPLNLHQHHGVHPPSQPHNDGLRSDNQQLVPAIERIASAQPDYRPPLRNHPLHNDYHLRSIASVQPDYRPPLRNRPLHNDNHLPPPFDSQGASSENQQPVSAAEYLYEKPATEFLCQKPNSAINANQDYASVQTCEPSPQNMTGYTQPPYYTAEPDQTVQRMNKQPSQQLGDKSLSNSRSGYMTRRRSRGKLQNYV